MHANTGRLRTINQNQNRDNYLTNIKQNIEFMNVDRILLRITKWKPKKTYRINCKQLGGWQQR
jgi:hypothetical protein